MTTTTEIRHGEPGNMFGKIVLVVAILTGLGHTATWSVEMDEVLRLCWRFASVGTLALYALLTARDLNGWLLTAVMLISATSDVLLVIIGRDFGAMCFVVADFIAILLYYRNFRTKVGVSSLLGVAFFVAAIAALSYILPANRSEAIIIAIFVVPLATMTAFSFLTHFPLKFVGLGTVMILASDLLIFGRMGPLNGLAGLTEAIWLCYFMGEVLVVVGVTSNFQTGQRLGLD